MKWDLILFISIPGIALLIAYLTYALKKSRNELAEIKLRFHGIFDLTTVGIAHVSLEGKFLEVNRKWCEIVGYSEDDMRNLTFQDITHPDDLADDLELVRQVLEREMETYSMDKRYYRENGSLVWVNLSVALVLDEDNSPQCFISIIQDISKRKQLERELREHNVDMRHMLAAIPEAVFLVRQPERTIEWIHDSYDIMGYGESPKDVKGISTLDFFANKKEFDHFGQKRMEAELAGDSYVRLEVV